MTTPERRTEERRVTREEATERLVTAARRFVREWVVMSHTTWWHDIRDALVDFDALPTPEANGEGDAAWEALTDDLWDDDQKIDPDTVIARHRPLIEAAIRATVTAGEDGPSARQAAQELCRLWFDLAGPENKAATYAALVNDPDDLFSNAMWSLRASLLKQGDRFTGPDCGVDGCARELGHTGNHRPDPALAPRETPVAGLDVERPYLAHTEVEAGYIQTPDRHSKAYWRKVARAYDEPGLHAAETLAAVTPEPGALE